MALYIIILLLSNILFAPLSTMMLWKRYTNFTDGFAHAAIMSVIISSLLDINIFLGAIINGFVFIGLIYLLKSQNDNNLIITIISFFLLSLATLLADFIGINLDIRKILFGNIYSANIDMIVPILLMILCTYIFLYFYFSDFILLSLNKDLALSRNIKVNTIELIFLSLIVITIGICMKFTGTLIIFGILAIPPATARLLSYSPKMMVFYATIIGKLSAVISIVIWSQYKVSLAPLLICINFTFFALVKIYQNITSRVAIKTS